MAELLEASALTLRTAQGGALNPVALQIGYFAWAGEQMRVFVTMMPPGELDRLVTTPWHWSLSSMDPNAQPALTYSSVTAQITETLRRLDEESKELKNEIARWGEGRAAAAVLDTNVLTDHWHRLAEMDWPVALGVTHMTDIVLAIPVAVIDELEKLKQSNQREPRDSGRADLRDRARHALKWIESTVFNPSAPAVLETAQGPGRPRYPLRLMLIQQDARHVPIADTDSEIIDRALSVTGYAKQVTLITSDTSMLFRARMAGLKASRPEPEQANDGTRP